jgi:hypothetical protein
MGGTKKSTCVVERLASLVWTKITNQTPTAGCKIARHRTGIGIIIICDCVESNDSNRGLLTDNTDHYRYTGIE